MSRNSEVLVASVVMASLLVCGPAVAEEDALRPRGEVAFTQVAVGEWHGCGLREDGVVACWGEDSWGQSRPLDGRLDGEARVAWRADVLESFLQRERSPAIRRAHRGVAPAEVLAAAPDLRGEIEVAGVCRPDGSVAAVRTVSDTVGSRALLGTLARDWRMPPGDDTVPFRCRWTIDGASPT